MLSMQLKMDNELYKMENLHLSCQGYCSNPPWMRMFFFWLVVEPTPLEKYDRQIGLISPGRGENQKYWKAPPSF